MSDRELRAAADDLKEKRNDVRWQIVCIARFLGARPEEHHLLMPRLQKAIEEHDALDARYNAAWAAWAEAIDYQEEPHAP